MVEGRGTRKSDMRIEGWFIHAYICTSKHDVCEVGCGYFELISIYRCCLVTDFFFSEKVAAQ